MCFEVEGAELARRLLERMGMPPGEAERVAIAIILHMQPVVTLDDGVEAVLLDRATGLDVRGAEFELVHDVRGAVMRAYPRGAFDRHFLDAIRRESGRAPGLSERTTPERDRSRSVDGPVALALHGVSVRSRELQLTAPGGRRVSA